MSSASTYAASSVSAARRLGRRRSTGDLRDVNSTGFSVSTTGRLGHQRSDSNSSNTSSRLGVALDDLKDTLSAIITGEVDEIPEEDVKKIEEVVERSKEVVAWKAQRKKQNPFRIAQSVTFSAATNKHLEDAGMLPQEKLTPDSFKAKMQRSWLANIKEPGISAANLLKIEKYDYSEVHSKIKMMRRMVNDAPEASARQIIDQWILTLMFLCGNMGLAILLFPELVISRSSEAAVVVCGESTDTRFTGRTDYVAWTVQHAEASAIERMRKNMHSIKNLEGILAMRKDLRHDASSARLVLLEAKNLHEDLMDHLSQVAAQSLAGITFKGQGSVSAIAFILTNSKDWIFGVVHVTLDKATSKEVRECLHTPVLSFDGVGEHIVLMNALYVWANRPTIELVGILAK